MKRLRLLHLATIIFLLFFSFVIFSYNKPWPTEIRDYLAETGNLESGASNLVSAIYLGYRAFDTLGETVVLIVSIIGTVSIVNEMKRMSRDTHTPISFNFALEKEKRASHSMRTHLLEVVTSKIGPVILLYGFYVMMYGHISPGGGFQGGVIIASGIILFFLGYPYERGLESRQRRILLAIESISFMAFISVSLLSIIFEQPFFSNFFPRLPLPKEGFIILLNSIIGLKVGSGIAFMSISMMEERQ